MTLLNSRQYEKERKKNLYEPPNPNSMLPPKRPLKWKRKENDPSRPPPTLMPAGFPARRVNLSLSLKGGDRTMYYNYVACAITS
jgi:hypothetical protein